MGPVEEPVNQEPSADPGPAGGVGFPLRGLETPPSIQTGRRG